MYNMAGLLAFVIGAVWLLVSSVVIAGLGLQEGFWAIVSGVFLFMAILAIVFRFFSLNFMARANDLESQLDFWATRNVNGDRN